MIEDTQRDHRQDFAGLEESFDSEINDDVNDYTPAQKSKQV
jgi:hypothetical protein